MSEEAAQPDLLAGAGGGAMADAGPVFPRWFERAPPSSLCDEMDLFGPSYLDDLVNAVQGPAIDAVQRRRVEQLVGKGYDRAHDLAKAPAHFLVEMRERLGHAAEMIARGAPSDCEAARIKIEVLCALGLALWDRLGAEIETLSETQLSTRKNGHV